MKYLLTVIIFILLNSSELQARTMYKIKCYTPSPQEDRSELAKMIHLDMITDEYVISVVNEIELKEIYNKTNLNVEVLSSFDTEKTTYAQTTLNSILSLSDPSDQTIEIFQSYITSTKSSLEIDLNKLLQEKNPLEKRNLDFSVLSNSGIHTDYKFDNTKSQLILTPNALLKNKVDRFEFSSSMISPPTVKIILEITYL